MTEGMNVHVGTKGKKVQQQSTFSQQTQSNKDIALFGDNGNSGVPYKPTDPKLPSIFDDNGYQFPFDPSKKKPSTTPSPIMTQEMRREYNERTVVSIYKYLSSPNITKKNTAKLIQSLRMMDTNNYKYVFRSFEAAGIPLSDVIMATPHLNDKQKQECMDFLVDLGKKTADYGNQRSDDVIPNMKDLVKKYDKGLDKADKKRLSADFKKLINRSDTLATEVPARPNGKLDGTFKQGNTGDCWLLSGLQALSMTKEGKELLDKSIKIDEKGNATVTLSNVGKTYTITARDLKCSNELSTGDTDFRALEIAVDRYFREAMPDGIADIDGNTSAKAFEVLVGSDNIKSAYNPRSLAMMIDDVRLNGMQGRAGVTGLAGNIDPSNIVATNEKGERVKVYNGHAYTLKNADKNYVYLINPHNSASTIKISRNQYLSKFSVLSIVDLNNK